MSSHLNSNTCFLSCLAPQRWCHNSISMKTYFGAQGWHMVLWQVECCVAAAVAMRSCGRWSAQTDNEVEQREVPWNTEHWSGKWSSEVELHTNFLKDKLEWNPNVGHNSSSRSETPTRNPPTQLPNSPWRSSNKTFTRIASADTTSMNSSST